MARWSLLIADDVLSIIIAKVSIRVMCQNITRKNYSRLIHQLIGQNSGEHI